jgi:hypothetical protein
MFDNFITVDINKNKLNARVKISDSTIKIDFGHFMSFILTNYII